MNLVIENLSSLTLKHGKTAFMKTMEAFLAILIVFTFLLVFLPRDVRYTDDQSSYLLKNLERNDEFRNCVLVQNDTCISTVIDTLFEGRYLFEYSIYKKVEPEQSFNASSIRAYQWFFSGNHTHDDSYIFKLYYWEPQLK
jgi:hypothetical protein